jgi:taurine dioxygenase
MKNSTIDVRPVSASTGAEIRGVDLAAPMQERAYREIRNALNEYGVIFFRDQDLTPSLGVLARLTSTASLRRCRATR